MISLGSISWKVTKGSSVVVKDSMVDTLYLLTNILNYSMNIVSTGESASIWHNRFGHMSERGMKILHSRNLLPNLKEVDMGFYEDCVYGKQRRVSFLKVGKERRKKKLELVHTYLWGLS